MIEEIILFSTAVAFATFVMLRTPKLTLPKQFELVEREIKEWLNQPITPCEKEWTNTSTKSIWSYGQGAKPTTTTVGLTAVLSITALDRQGQNQLDMA